MAALSNYSRKCLLSNVHQKCSVITAVRRLANVTQTDIQYCMDLVRQVENIDLILNALKGETGPQVSRYCVFLQTGGLITRISSALYWFQRLPGRPCLESEHLMLR